MLLLFLVCFCFAMWSLSVANQTNAVDTFNLTSMYLEDLILIHVTFCFRTHGGSDLSY